MDWRGVLGIWLVAALLLGIAGANAYSVPANQAFRNVVNSTTAFTVTQARKTPGLVKRAYSASKKQVDAWMAQPKATPKPRRKRRYRSN